MTIDQAENTLWHAIREVGSSANNIRLHNWRGKKKMHDYVGKAECIKCQRTHKRYYDAISNLIVQMILIGRK